MPSGPCRSPSTGRACRLPGMHPDLAFALDLADLADAITVERFQADDLVVETKPDLSPVTEADRAVEQVLRKRIGEERPGHSVVGEELGADGKGAPAGSSTRSTAPRTTCAASRCGDAHRPRARGPGRGRGGVGAGAAPAVVGGAGRGAFVNGRRIRVSKVAELSDAVLSYASLLSWEQHGLGEQFLTLARGFWRTRGSATSGDTCWSPRARPTWPSSRRSSCGTWRRPR